MQVKTISEIPFEEADRSNPKKAIMGAMSLLEQDEILTLPLRKQKKTAKIDGKIVTYIESSIDFSKSMRISQLI